MPAASLDVGPDGRVGVVWTSGHENEDLNVYFAESIDSGISFGANSRMHDTTGGVQVEPAVAYDAPGTIHAFWRSEVKNRDYDIHYVCSGDGGATFSAPERVNDDPPGSMNAQQGVDAAGLPTEGVMAVWLDSRENAEENVYFANSAAALAIDPVDGDDAAGGSPAAAGGRVFPNPTQTGAWFEGRAATLYDARGRLVRRLVSHDPYGSSWIYWDGRDLSGARLVPGAYFVRLETERGGLLTRRLTVSR
jgi:hypothetical protein